MKKAGSNKDWLTTGEAAEVMGMSRQAIINAAIQGRLAYQRVGDFYLIRREAAEAYKKMKPGRKKKADND